MDDPSKPPIEFVFSKDHIKVGFAVLADYTRVQEQGTYFYKVRTQRSIDSGSRTIYILAQGTRHIKHAYELASWLDSQHLVKSVIPLRYKRYSWSGEVPSLCIICDVRPGLESNKASLDGSAVQMNEADVFNTLSSEIEEIQTGEIQVIKIGIIHGRVQVAIHSTRMDSRHALSLCIGPNGTHAKRLQEKLKVYVRFIPWSPDLKQYIIDNLEIDANQVIDVKIDPAQKIALVAVPTDDIAAKARGLWNDAPQIAGVMTEYAVEVFVDPRSKLLDTLKDIIPEVQHEEIKIREIANTEGIQIKIQVYSDGIDRPAAICGSHRKEIQNRLGTKEWILVL